MTIQYASLRSGFSPAGAPDVRQHTLFAVRPVFVTDIVAAAIVGADADSQGRYSGGRYDGLTDRGACCQRRAAGGAAGYRSAGDGGGWAGDRAQSLCARRWGRAEEGQAGGVLCERQRAADYGGELRGRSWAG